MRLLRGPRVLLPGLLFLTRPLTPFISRRLVLWGLQLNNHLILLLDFRLFAFQLVLQSLHLTEYLVFLPLFLICGPQLVQTLLEELFLLPRLLLKRF